MCSLNGGLFVKVGQHIGSLEYLLPLEYVRTFKRFHSEAPKATLSELKEVIREDLGKPGMNSPAAMRAPCCKVFHLKVPC